MLISSLGGHYPLCGCMNVGFKYISSEKVVLMVISDSIEIHRDLLNIPLRVSTEIFIKLGSIELKNNLDILVSKKNV